MIDMIYFIISNKMPSSAEDNYAALMSLPIVQELLRKNKKLRKENRSLRNLIYSIPEFRCDCSNESRRRTKRVVEIKPDPDIEPTPCDTLVDDDQEVIHVQKPNVDNVVYVIDNESEVEEFSDAEEPPLVATQKAAVEEEEEEAVEEEEEAVEDDAVEEEEDEVVEEEEEEQVQQAEAENEVFEIQISGKAYYTTNEINGSIYAIDDNEDVGDEVGVFKEGKPVFHKKGKK